MDLRVLLFASGAIALAATLIVKSLVAAFIGGALMLAAIAYGWVRRQRMMRAKVREARRKNPELHRSRRSYYLM